MEANDKHEDVHQKLDASLPANMGCGFPLPVEKKAN